MPVWIAIVVLFLSLPILSCGRIGYDLLPAESEDSEIADTDADADSDADADADADTDADADADTDADTDTNTDSVTDSASDSGIDTSDTSYSTDSSSSGSDTDTGTDTGTDTDYPSFDARDVVDIRVPISAVDGALYFEMTSNVLGLQGSWYSFSGDGSTIVLSQSIGGYVCAAGQVAGDPGNQYNYVGIGISLCMDFNSAEQHPLGACPWSPHLMDRVIGISFEITDAFPVAGTLTVDFKETSGAGPSYWTIPAAGTYDVLFANTLPTSTITPADVNLIQFQLGHTDSTDIAFGFCIGKVEILLSPP